MAISDVNLVPPKSAQNNAKKAIEWKDKHGDEVKGGTQVGWTRARQLASGKALSPETVKRMAAFNRHRKNAEVAPEHKSEPWKDNGYVAWLIWGGTSGVDWAMRKSKELDRAKESFKEAKFKPGQKVKTPKGQIGIVRQYIDGNNVVVELQYPNSGKKTFDDTVLKKESFRESIADLFYALKQFHFQKKDIVKTEEGQGFVESKESKGYYKVNVNGQPKYFHESKIKFVRREAIRPTYGVGAKVKTGDGLSGSITKIYKEGNSFLYWVNNKGPFRDEEIC